MCASLSTSRMETVCACAASALSSSARVRTISTGYPTPACAGTSAYHVSGARRSRVHGEVEKDILRWGAFSRV